MKLSTIFKEGGEDSPYSSKRIIAFLLLIIGTGTLPKSIALFSAANGWAGAFVFFPFALCVVAMVLLLYFNTLIDIKNLIKSGKELLKDEAQSK